jgi:para-aminobenzoate synthetase component 1
MSTGERAFALDSAQSNDGLGQWSFFGANPFKVISGGAGLAELRAEMEGYAGVVEGGIPFIGGAVGYLAYDYGRRLERLPERAVDDRGIPDLCFGLYDGIAALEHHTGKLYLVALGIRAPAGAVLDELEAQLRQTLPPPVQTPPVRGPWQWNSTEAEFMESVERIKAYIASGDAYQVNLSRRACCPYAGSPLQLYEALRRGNPAPFGAYLTRAVPAQAGSGIGLPPDQGHASTGTGGAGGRRPRGRFGRFGKGTGGAFDDCGFSKE